MGVQGCILCVKPDTLRWKRRSIRLFPIIDRKKFFEFLAILNIPNTAVCTAFKVVVIFFTLAT